MRKPVEIAAWSTVQVIVEKAEKSDIPDIDKKKCAGGEREMGK